MLKPWMQLYTGEFLNKTAHLSAEETGAYIRLLIACWEHVHLPDDDARLARVAGGVSVDLVEGHEANLRTLFGRRVGRLSDLRIFGTQADETHRKLSEAGKKRWADRAPSPPETTGRLKTELRSSPA